MIRYSDYLAHFNPNHDPRTGQFASGPTANFSYRKVKRVAKKDAKEFARAKMFYGEGAGNRRKLIKASVQEKSKDPRYKDLFDQFLQEQDMSKHASAAKAERTRKDIAKGTAKTARGVYHTIVGDGAKVAASVALGFTILRATGYDQKVGQALKSGFNSVVNFVTTRTGKLKFEDLMARYGGSSV